MECSWLVHLLSEFPAIDYTLSMTFVSKSRATGYIEGKGSDWLLIL
jgi:hypothetical protein